MKETALKHRLWAGFTIHLFFLPSIFFGLMLWAIASTQEKLDHMQKVVERTRGLDQVSTLLARSEPVQVTPPAAQTLRALATDPAFAATAARVERALESASPQTRSDAADQVIATRAALWESYDLAATELQEIKRTTYWVYFLILPLAFGIIIAVSVAVVRRITGPLEALTQSARTMAEGDLRHEVQVPQDRELSLLARAFNELRERMRALLSQVQAHAEQVVTTTTSVSAATTQLADGASEQSAATEETSSALEEIAAQIQSVSANASSLADDAAESAKTAQQIGLTADGLLRAARDLDTAVERAADAVERVSGTAEQSASTLGEVAEAAENIDRQAAEGTQALKVSIEQMQSILGTTQRTNEAFQSLNQRSRQITGIVEAMAEIADQTSLLALNAAIEAARAGDSGRGFAVVADEVRKLAERAVGSAKEVGQLIGTVRDELENAVKLAEQNTSRTTEGVALLTGTGQRVQGVVDATRKVGALVTRVSGAVEQQASSARSLRQEVDRVRAFSSSLAQTAAAQAQSSAQVVQNMERMSARTRQVADATVQIRTGGDQVLKAVEDISKVARQGQEAVAKVSQSMQGLLGRVSTLQEQVGRIHVTTDREPARA